jgi:FdrA protein
VHVAVKILSGLYVDSVALMRVAEETRRLPGVVSATVLVATEANRDLLAEAGLSRAEAARAGPGDLVVAVSAATPDGARAALAQAEALLAVRRPAGEAEVVELPRSLVAAARRLPDATLALISVPGRYAVAEAQQALSAGLNVFLFSDGVELVDEARLKRRARARGLLVMGPECGTSILNGVGIGFANAVRRGAVGLVGASGTGLQEVSTLVHRLGAGVSHAIGTGGRDLHAGVGAVTTLQALALLAADPFTRVVVLVSKPADPGVAETVLAEAARIGKPVIACLLGWRGKVPAGVTAADTLEAAAVAAVGALGVRARPLTAPRPRRRLRRGGRVHGLYTGGTLCEEAQAIVADAGGRFVDFGAAEYTRGRPHPMIDPELRNRAIAATGDDPTAAVLLLDFVLGHSAHPDPAGAAAPAIGEARARARRRRRQLAVVAHVLGTEEDPQGLARQEATLRALGVTLCPSNRLAAVTARVLVGGRGGR